MASTAMAGAPDFPPPPEATVEWVGKNIEVNSIRSSIRVFHTRNKIEKVVEFYRKEWKKPVGKDMPGFMETIDSAPWYIISRIENGYLLTVQVQVKEKGGRGSWGYLSTSPLPEKDKTVVLGNDVPKMADTQVLTETKSKDPGKKAKTLILSSTNSIRVM